MWLVATANHKNKINWSFHRTKNNLFRKKKGLQSSAFGHDESHAQTRAKKKQEAPFTEGKRKLRVGWLSHRALLES